jgi:DNA polymerase-3 subunit gamma/tau
VRGDNALLGACIEEARPVEVTGEDLTVAFAATAPFLKKKAENPENRAAVTAALRDVTGRRWRLSYELHEGLELEDGELSEEEWLKRFIDEFDAEELPGDWAPAEGGNSPIVRGAQDGAEALTSEEKGA